MKTITCIIAFFLSLNFSMADTIGVNIELVYVQNADDTYSIKASVVDEDDEGPLADLSITFSAQINGASIQLGSVVTAANGKTEYTGNLMDLRKKGHQFKFLASFAGNDDFSESEAAIDITDATLSLVTEIVDSVNTVFVSLAKWDKDGETVPVSDEEIKLFVPRMYSLLPVVDAYTSEEGKDEVEFPNDIPGGPNGELAVIGRLEDSSDFGTLVARSETTWGLPVSQTADRLPRALWSPDAPLWMVITFVILMTGVWGHYLWIVFNLFKIKRLRLKDSPIIYSE